MKIKDTCHLFRMMLIGQLILLIFASNLPAQTKKSTEWLKIQGEAITILVPQKVQLPQKELKTESITEKLDSLQLIDSVMNDELNRYTIAMRNQKFISENVVPEVKLDIINEEKPSLKVEYSYSLLNDSLKYQTDDFTAGNYRVQSSNAMQVALAFMKKSLEGELAKYLTSGKEVIVTIEGNADAMPVRNPIVYKGEYGNPLKENCLVDGSNCEITVTTTSGIDNNISLAFMRSYSVRSFMEQQIAPLNSTRNTFIHRASVSNYRGGKFRRVYVQLEIPGVFENTLTQ